MGNEVYEKTLAAALADLKGLQSKRMEIDKKIVSTKQMIVSLRALLGKRSTAESGLGLKGACLEVFNGETEPLTLGQVAHALEKIGFSLDGYSNPMSAVKNTLVRMVGKEIEVSTVKGKKVYKSVIDDKWKF